MAQQSTTRPREALKVQGKRTQEQQQRIINKDEKTKGADVPVPGETLKHAATRYPKPGPGSENQMSTGHREIQRGANDEREHHKRRDDD
jgi:hypothetical protein